MMTGCTAIVSLLACACALASGCADPLASRTAGFAAAAAPSLTDVRGGYALAQSSHAAAILAKNVAAYDSTPIDKLRQSPEFGTREDLRLREQILRLLSGYVAQLAELSGHQKTDGAAAAAKDAGAASGKEAEDTLAVPTAPGDVKAVKLSNAQLQQAAGALQTLEGLLVERAHRRALPHILAQADGPIDRICASLRSDFDEAGTPGLRAQAHEDFELRITNADAAIRHPHGSLSSVEREHAIEAEFALVREEQQTDAALAETGDTLVQFAAAHHALLESVGRGSGKDAAFDKALGRLALDARQLADAEHALSVVVPPAAEVPADRKDLP